MLPQETKLPSIRVGFTRTQGEWEALDKLFKENKTDFHSYVRRASSRLRNKARECMVCVTPASGVKVDRRHQIPTEIYNDLLEVALLKGQTVGDVLNELLFTPLLLPDKDVAL